MTTSQAPVAAHSDEPHSPEPFTVLAELVHGNERFMSGTGTHDREDPARRRTLVSGQTPKAIVLSCSDSRVPPELVFDQGLGDLFVVRTAGEVPDSIALGSIEYAVEHLKSPLMVVMGHESCGAVKAAVSTPDGQSAGSPNLDALVASIKPHLTQTAVASHDSKLNGPVKAHVEGVAGDVVARSEIIRNAVERGELRIVTGVYRLDSGKVDFWH